MPITEGTTSYPDDNADDKGIGLYDGTNFYHFRADNSTGKNLRVALYAADGSVLIGAKNSAGSIPVVLASDQAAIPVTLGADTDVIGKVSIDQTTPGTTDRVTVGGIATPEVTPTVSSSPAYTAGDAVGGKMSFANAVRVSGGSGIIQSVRLVDQAKQSTAIDIIFFEADISTTVTDNAALDLADADALLAIGHVSIAATDYCALSDNSFATKTAIGLPFKLASGTTLYAAMVARGTPTFAATTDVVVQLGILQD
jgi:hypothetical protein